jgi:hypothetical protein
MNAGAISLSGKTVKQNDDVTFVLHATQGNFEVVLGI